MAELAEMSGRYEEAEILCFEPANVLNTGNVTDATFTAPKGARV